MRTTSNKPRRASRRAVSARRAKEPTERFQLRLVASIAARIGALLPRYSRPWRDAQRTDVLRAVILRGLDVIEAEGDAPPKSTGRRRTPQ